MTQEQWTAVDRYITDVLIPSDEVLNAALEYATKAGLPTINVAPNQGKLLSILAPVSYTHLTLPTNREV